MPRHLVKAALMMLMVAGCAPSGCTPSGADVTLTATMSQPVYQADQAVEIVLTLQNKSSSDIVLSPDWIGNVRVLEFSQNGALVPLRATYTLFDVALGTRLESSLAPLPAGQSLTIRVASYEDVAFGGQTLRTVIFDTREVHPARDFFLLGPGDFRLKLAYHYLGPDGGQSVFRDELRSNEVSFRIEP